MSLTAMSLTLNCVTSIQRNRTSEDQFLKLSGASHEYIVNRFCYVQWSCRKALKFRHV